nr:MAG TPA: hypothetical protein [Caudoviricetes sp.]
METPFQLWNGVFLFWEDEITNKYMKSPEIKNKCS